MRALEIIAAAPTTAILFFLATACEIRPGWGSTPASPVRGYGALPNTLLSEEGPWPCAEEVGDGLGHGAGDRNDLMHTAIVPCV